jgi:hypothetical protein
MQTDAAVASRFLTGGATVLPIGIAFCAMGAPIGSVVTLVGLALLIAGLHTYGRAGPDRGNQGPS